MVAEFTTLRGFGGSSRVRTASLQREIEAQRRRQTQGLGPNLSGTPGGAIQSLFGLGPTSITGNPQVAREGGGAVAQAGDIAARFAQGVPQQELSEEQQAGIEQFFNPSVTDEQQQALRRFATISAGQGILGGAVGAQLSDAAARFTGANRAASFGTVAPLLQRGFNQLQQEISPFLSQLGGFQSLAEFGQTTPFLLASGQNANQFSGFLNPALRALQAFGLGGDALAGLAERGNVRVGAGGTTGNDLIAQAFADFAAPGTSGIESFVRQQAGGRAGVSPQAFRARQRAFLAGSRLGAAEQLGGAVQSRFADVQRSVAEFEGARQAAGVFEGSGTLEGARRLASLDTSQFDPLLRQLGVQPRRFSNVRPTLSGQGQFVPADQLFRNVIGI